MSGKGFLRRIANRWLHVLARHSPGATTLRPMLHRWRGATVGRDVFIGEDVYLDNEYPECIEIQDNVQISVRTIVIAHTKGSGRVVIEKDAFVGPNCVLVCGAGRTLKVGHGAVVGAGSVLTKSVAPHLYVAPPQVVPMARVNVPLPAARTMEEFWAGLSPLDKPPRQSRKVADTRSAPMPAVALPAEEGTIEDQER